MSPAPIEPDQSTYKGRLSARIRMLRKEAGLTTEEAWKRVIHFNKTDRDSPKSLTGYLSWESGKGTPHYDLLPVLVKALKLKDVHDLMPKK